MIARVGVGGMGVSRGCVACNGMIVIALVAWVSG